MHGGEPAADETEVYRSRFAPSPTGPLHFGSLVAALGSYLDARATGGEWRVRMEDLDRPREVPGAATAILHTLEAFGFEWDGQVLRQSARTQAYAQAIERLRAAGLVFPCACSRREIAANGLPGAEGRSIRGPAVTAYHWGNGPAPYASAPRAEPSWSAIGARGHCARTWRARWGDFVLRRADGIHAYQLAVVVDDGFQGINQIVRGADLLTSTPRQIALLQALWFPVPTYAHLPLVVDGTGRKLSKSHAAAPADPAAPLPTLLRAWHFLGQKPFPEPPAGLAAFWTQARSTWNMDRVPNRRSKALAAEWDRGTVVAILPHGTI